MVVTGSAGRFRSSLSPKEDERRGTPGGVEECLEGVLFSLVHFEKISMELSLHSAQPSGLLSFPVDATPVCTEEGH
jgi:hypothetical protein